jgi:hypothetical protein
MLVEILLDRVMEVQYGFLTLCSAQTTDDEDADRDAWRGQTNGLLGAAVPEMLRLRTDTHTGPVGIRIELHDHAPQLGDDWAEVVEASYASWVDDLVLSSFDQFARDIPLPPGSYQVRYCNRPGEQCLLQFWPAADVDRIVRRTGEWAAYWHRTGTVEPWTADELRSRVEEMGDDEEPDDLPPGAGYENLIRGLGFSGRDVGAIDPVLAARLTAVDDSGFRAIAFWAVEQALTMTGIRDRPEIDAALSAARRGVRPAPGLMRLPRLESGAKQAAALLQQAAGPLDMETTCSILINAGRCNGDRPDWIVAALRHVFASYVD